MVTEDNATDAQRSVEPLPNGCSCGHVTLAGREYARYVDPADMGEHVLPTSFSLRTVHDAIRAIESEARAAALREVGERVEALPEGGGWPYQHLARTGYEAARAAVLSILTEATGASE